MCEMANDRLRVEDKIKFELFSGLHWIPGNARNTEDKQSKYAKTQ